MHGDRIFIEENYTRIQSTTYQLCINYISTMYQLHINYISTTYQLCINYVSTTYQLPNITIVQDLFKARAQEWQTQKALALL